MAETEGHGRKIKQEKLLSALRGGNTRKAAIEYAEIDKQTFYNWLEDSTFFDSVQTAEVAPEITCASSIITAAKKDWRAAAWWLERRRSANWKEIKQIEWPRLTIDQLIQLAGAGEGGVDSPGDQAASAAALPEALSE